MIRFLIILILPIIAFASQVQYLRWDGNSYLKFLQENHLPLKQLYYNLSGDNQRAIAEIQKGTHYQVLKDSNGTVEQVLIPISDELQIHIVKNNIHSTFKLIPIISTTKQEGFVLHINNSPYYDILKDTNSRSLASIFLDSFKKSINFKRDIHKGDKVVMVYDQKYRFGHVFSMPKLLAAMVQTGKTKHYVYNFHGRYYDSRGHQLQGFIFIRPVKGGWISSTFSLRRWQPILHIYRPHFGVDYAVVIGTPIHAAASGKIIYAGWIRGYGNVIKISNGDGYVTLYAHQKRFKRGIRVGKYVKQGQIIGYVGVTGLSTGPHLHFGVYRYGRAINPELVVQKATKRLWGKAKKSFIAYKEKMDKNIDRYILKNTPPPVIKPFKPMCKLDITKHSTDVMESYHQQVQQRIKMH